MKIIKTILQRLYPYGTFTISSSSSSPFRGTEGVLGVVYLTFDDGPIPEVTPKVLEILDRYQVKATFFMVGENIDKHPDIFRMVLDAGHAVGNHTYNHLKGIKYSCSEYLSNVQKWEDAWGRGVSSSSPLSSPFRGTEGVLGLFRPPYGKAWFWQRRAIKRRGYRLIYWDVLTRDYDRTRTPEAMLAQIKRCTRPGSIINFHDSLKSNERMLAVLPLAIEWLLAQGYELKCIN